MIEGEKQLDALRLAVLENKDFDFIDAFALFDVEQSGQVTQTDLESSLDQEFNQVASKRELQLLFLRLSKSNEEVIRFSDFVELMTGYEPSPESRKLIKKRLRNTAKQSLIGT